MSKKSIYLPKQKDLLQSLLILLIITCCLATASYADNEESASENDTKSTSGLLFNPPMLGAPSTRVGGGVRGPEGDAPLLRVLTPEQTGISISASPNLYWYQSKPATDMLLEFALYKDEELVVSVTYGQAEKEGIQYINLDAFDVELDFDVEYEWIVSLISDPDERTLDIVASSTVQRIQVPEELNKLTGDEVLSEKIAMYGKHGIWYNLLDVLYGPETQNNPTVDLVKLRIDLLDQVKLDEVASYEKKNYHL